jgi:hypothetical protein
MNEPCIERGATAAQAPLRCNTKNKNISPDQEEYKAVNGGTLSCHASSWYKLKCVLSEQLTQQKLCRSRRRCSNSNFIHVLEYCNTFDNHPVEMLPVLSRVIGSGSIASFSDDLFECSISRLWICYICNTILVWCYAWVCRFNQLPQKHTKTNSTSQNIKSGQSCMMYICW